MDGKPFLFDRRDSPGLLGAVARWNSRRRVRRIRRARERMRA